MSQRLNLWIGLGLVLGLIVGLGTSMTGASFLTGLARISAPFGQLFINAIRMVVIPLVVAVVFASVAKAAGSKALRDAGMKTAFFYGLSLIPAIAIGMIMMRAGMTFLPVSTSLDPVETDLPELPGLVDFLIGLVPSNPFAAASNGALLPLIVFTLLVAMAAGSLDTERRDRLVTAAEDISEALIKLIWWVLHLAPIGIFGLIAPATAQMGGDLILSFGLFIGCVLVGLLVFLCLIYGPLLIIAGMKPTRFLKGTTGSASVAFATTSTAAAIPVSLRETVNNLCVSKSVADLIIPLGASLYRPGSALFQGAAIVFLAHLYGVPLDVSAYTAILFGTLIVSLTIAPVPSASIVTMAPVLATVGVPATGLGLLLGIDRIPDMFRSSVNLWGQIVAAVVADNETSRRR